ncbi:MAG: sulfite exporter TauE/SafE family protein [Candidatus Hydrogenedentota bacterium]
MKLIILFIMGLFAGCINTIVGAGSFFSIPSLLLFGLDAKIAVATNRFSFIFLALTNSATLYKNKVLNLKRALKFSIFASLGSLLGAHFVVKINESIMENIVIVLLLVIFFKYLIPANRLNLTPKINCIKYKFLFYLLLFIIGIYGGFFGVAITVFFVASMVFFLDLPLIEAMATNQIIILFISIVASIIFIKNRLVDYYAAVPLITGMSAGGFITFKFIIESKSKKLEKIFIVALGLMILITFIKFKFF